MSADESQGMPEIIAETEYRRSRREARMTVAQGPIGPSTAPSMSRGDCRCNECVRYQRQVLEAGKHRVHWGAVNEAVHGSKEHRAEMARELGFDPATPPLRQRITHVNGIQLPFPVTVEQFLGGSVGLVASLPIISAFGMAPVPGMWLLGILTALGGTSPWIIRKSRDTEKRKMQNTTSSEKDPTKTTRQPPAHNVERRGLPFSVPFDRLVGGIAGVSLSLPMISVFGMNQGEGGLLAGMLAIAGAYVPTLIRKSKGTDKQQRLKSVSSTPSRKARMSSVRQDHEGVLLAWAKYETDVALQIDYPAMTDVRKPETAALAKALRAAEIASRHAGESIDSLIRYEAAVLDLEASFKAAETAAKLDHESPLTEDQKALAHTLLAMAVDPNGNLHERRQAHQRLLKLLDGVVVLAEPARLALEAAAAKREIGS